MWAEYISRSAWGKDKLLLWDFLRGSRCWKIEKLEEEEELEASE